MSNRDGGSRGGHGGGDQDANMAPFVPADALDAEGGGIFGDNPDIEYDPDADEADVLEREVDGIDDKAKEERASLDPLYNDMKFFLKEEVSSICLLMRQSTVPLLAGEEGLHIPV